MNSLNLYLKMMSMTMKSQMEYKLSFILMSFGHFLITFIEFIGMYALFLRFDQINGWTIYEVACFYGLVNTSFAIAESIGRGFDVFHKHVRKGTFDRFLLRPRNITMQIISSEIQLMRIGRMLQGLLVLTWGLKHLEKTLYVFDYLIIIYAMICAVFFFIGLMVFQATLSFWSIESLEIMNAFTYGGVQTAQYPMDIYKDWFQKIFIFVIPIGSVTYFPLTAVLKESSVFLGLTMPLFGLGFFVAALLAFKVGTKYYCSTGS